MLEKVNYRGWPNCYRLTNDIVDVITTTDVGPRVIRFGFTNEENVFGVADGDAGLAGGDQWRLYGGHRLWHAPESDPRTYYPDNNPVDFEQDGEAIRVTQPTEPTTGIRKQIELSLSPDRAQVLLAHRLWNTNIWPVELAPWAITVMAMNGIGIVPLPPRGAHDSENLQPTATLALWVYTDMSDPRWTWGRQYMFLRQASGVEISQKAGVSRSQGWAAYWRDGLLFVKRFKPVGEAPYPDLGSSVELFTNATTLEVETLGPMTCLEPGGMVEHLEEWFLFRDVQMPATDDDVNRYVLPLIRETDRLSQINARPPGA
jgi:hypothetical protein